ncbi:MAG: FAD-binding protein, partial [Candidatus Dadabacteria bacterium]|nr:FAD-binding protein [Candidatus Dadabacteria bacterium]NIS10123.1 FAD-binding protein [Candidatus Dadabacteria bacterium]NIV40842.1 FAD-binding protein [Candidatus Dadabacteria bacterium]NIX16528.1 FAD-binding protein [Candidatus Dadabacteria bacterium]NIY23049.1 FAD-binding protein [Candidatus Dadabacteria bacterium]
MAKQTEYDVCIIGSGAGGAPAAYALGKAGFKTIVLEAGRRFKPEEYHLNKKDWENYPYPQPFTDFKNRSKERYTSTPTEKLNLKYSHLRSKANYRGRYNRSNNRQRPFVQRAKGVGGTTLHYQA